MSFRHYPSDDVHCRSDPQTTLFLQSKVAAAVALTRLAVGNTDNLREFVRAGGVPPLKQLLASGSPTARAAAQGALSSLAGGGNHAVQAAPYSPEQEDPGTAVSCCTADIRITDSYCLIQHAHEHQAINREIWQCSCHTHCDLLNGLHKTMAFKLALAQ